MKAVILAGGLGTRLRAVTGEHPKPLAPLLGRPVMEHAMSIQHRMERIAKTERPKTEKALRARFDARDFFGDEDFLIISGDAACDFRLDRLMELHRKKHAAVTIALSRESEPLRYGLAVTDGDGRIRSFIEKPDWPRVVTDLVNTGIYVLSPQVLARVPEGGGDFGRDLFPLLLKEDVPLYGQVMKGYWRDIGTPLDYYRCCADALEGKLKLTPGERFRQAAQEPASDSEEDGCVTLCTCQNRARLMGTLSELMLELGADYDDGIRLKGPHYELHISPSAVSSAVRVAVKSDDAEYARALCLAAGDVAKKLEM